MKLKSGIKALSLGVMLATASFQAQAQFTNVFSFGDSLSDPGNLGVFTNAETPSTDRLNWTDRVAANFGRTIAPAYVYSNGVPVLSTGTGFAVGGARTYDVVGDSQLGGAVNVGSATASAPFIPSTGTQVQNLLSRGAVDSKALYLFWIGGNNLADRITTGVVSSLGKGSVTAAATTAVTASIKADATDAVNQIKALMAAGAKNIVVLNEPNVTITPRLVANAALAANFGVSSASVTKLGLDLSVAYNNTLKEGLAGLPVLQFDIFTLLDQVVANPAAFGITDTTGVVCAGDAQTCVGPSDGKLFANPFHPTANVQAFVGQYIADTLRNTAAASDGASVTRTAVSAPLGRSGAEWRTIDTRTRAFQNFGQEGGRMFAAGDYADATSDAPNGSKAADGATTTFSIGYETTLSANTLVGGTFGREHGNFEVVNKAGRLVFDETMFSLYFSHKFDENWYLNGLASVGSLDFNSTRNVAIGPFTSQEKADFNGRHVGAKFQGGYLMRNAGYVHGPFVGVDYETVRTDAFSEGTSSNAIAVSRQIIEQAHTRIGYAVAGETTWAQRSVRPFAEASYNYQHLTDRRTFRAGLAASGTFLPVTVENETGGFGRLVLGLATKVTKDAELSLSLSSTFDNPSGRDTAVNIVLSAPL